MPAKRKSKSRTPAAVSKRRRPPPLEAEDDVLLVESSDIETKPKKSKKSMAAASSSANDDEDEDGVLSEAKFLGDPVEPEEARRRWPHRYTPPRPTQKKQASGQKSSDDDEEYIETLRHFTKAEVDGITYELEDNAHVKAGKKEEPYICKIIEMFEAVDGTLYFTAQWYYRATDTVIGHCFPIDPMRVFYSEVTNYNQLECLLGKLNIARFGLDIDPDAKCKLIERCDYYCDAKYLLPYSTFVNFPSVPAETSTVLDQGKVELTLLDLYSGCGGMSTGLCIGASSAKLNLVTKWAVDLNGDALKSLKINHEETEVREEAADNFLSLLKRFNGLCVYFELVKSDGSEIPFTPITTNDVIEEEGEEKSVEAELGDESEIYEVEKIIGIRCDLTEEAKEKEKAREKERKAREKERKAKEKERKSEDEEEKNAEDDEKDKKAVVDEKDKELLFKVKWKGYGAEHDTWEPLSSLTGCEQSIKDFVKHVYKSKLLPLPGDVDVVCGGPPCQGISGFNRFRNYETPLEDEKNRQLSVFMDIVDYLKPKYVLMENVVDLLKFSEGFLGRYALGRLVGMNYQVRMGMMCAGAYGLPQFRMRVFYWGALPTERLPQFPLPTHDVVFRGQIPSKWERNYVAYDEGHNQKLGKKLLLEDALSDLPVVGNDEERDEMPYGNEPRTDFQKFIRLTKDGLSLNAKLFDHRPYKLNADDYERVCRVPKKKGANFRNLPGVLVGEGNRVKWDPKIKRVLLKSGKPLVPNYAMSFVRGTSSKPFRRLWGDEIVSTVVTRAEPHNQAILHPLQDRVLTVRENARLQGFPDYYQLYGPIKERYMQVGNAVAVPVSRSLGYALGLAVRGFAGEDSLFELPNELHLPDGCFENGDYVGVDEEEDQDQDQDLE